MAFTRREGYKKVKPDWRKKDHRPEGRLIGIEFECEHPMGYKQILDALPEPKEAKNRPVTERDGSLDENNGLEIVFPPFKTAALKTSDTTKSYFARAVKALEQAGIEVHSECGMHMNVNTVGWTQDQRTAYVWFFHMINDRWLMNIGGRQLNDYCNQYYDMDWEIAENWQEHTTVAGLRCNRIEVRFPKTTTDLERVKNLTNFLELVEDYVKTPGTIEFMMDYGNREEGLNEEFLAWLDNNTARPRTCAAIKEVLLNGYSQKAPRARTSSATRSAL